MENKFERQISRVPRPRSRSNTVGFAAMCLAFVLNFFTVLIYFFFPYTDWLNVDITYIDKDDNALYHYILLSIYLIFFVLTIWSFFAASCSDPGFVPAGKKTYNPMLLLQREQILWTYLSKIGRSIRPTSTYYGDIDQETHPNVYEVLSQL